jgi:hypothetical protein
MKTKSSFLAFFGTAASLILLAGCASPGARHDHPADMDPQAMCEMHKKMMGSMTREQQQSMMDEHMKNMSPEMRSRMQAMHARCS